MFHSWKLVSSRSTFSRGWTSESVDRCLYKDRLKDSLLCASLTDGLRPFLTAMTKVEIIQRHSEAPRCRTSFKNIAQTKNIANVKHPDTSEGRKYGYVAQNSLRKTPGQRSCGFTSAPPYSGLNGNVSLRTSHQSVSQTHAMVAPMLKTAGIMEKA